MITYEEAKALANKTADELMDHSKDIVLWEKKTMRKPYGWVFFYTTQKYLETMDRAYLSPGTPRILVEKDGSVHLVPSSVHIDNFLKAHERKMMQQ